MPYQGLVVTAADMLADRELVQIVENSVRNLETDVQIVAPAELELEVNYALIVGCAGKAATYANHASGSKANAVFEVVKGDDGLEMWLVTQQDVNSGEELTVDYGPNYPLKKVSDKESKKRKGTQKSGSAKKPRTGGKGTGADREGNESENDK